MSGDSNAGNVTESQAGTNMAQAPAANTGTFGTKEAAKESAADAAAIAGQSIYNAKCGRCHGLKVTTDFTAERWASIIAVMAPRANLTDAERENVYAYVKANSKK
jgi:mono/diheme cytochrome c family protein